MAYDKYSQKIDNLEVDGLLGVTNSLAYKVHEIEKHFHNREYWFGKAASQVQGVTAGTKGVGTPFVTSSINTSDGFGAWIPILGSGDTPSVAGSGNVKFDLHRMVVTDVTTGDKLPHFIQFVWSTLGAGSTDEEAGDDGLANEDVSGFIFVPEKDGKSEPINMLMPRIAVGTRLLMRYKVHARNTAWGLIAGANLHFFVGLHEYEG